MIGSNAIELKSPEQIALMREAGHMLAEVFDEVLCEVKPGVTTRQLDRLAESAIRARGAKPAFLNYHGFPATVCTSVNEEVVHGIPGDRLLCEGDIVGLDMGLIHKEFYADRATTAPVGSVSPEVARLLRVTMECLERAIAAAVPGNRLRDIALAVQGLAEAEGYGVVREYSGHGIGRRLHEPPQVPNYWPTHGSAPGGNPRLKAGMALAIEPMINLGTWKTHVLSDQWTVVTQDELASAHFEHTIVITEAGPEVLTGDQPPLKEMELDTPG